jgi:hypothetical protein
MHQGVMKPLSRPRTEKKKENKKRKKKNPRKKKTWEIHPDEKA